MRSSGTSGEKKKKTGININSVLQYVFQQLDATKSSTLGLYQKGFEEPTSTPTQKERGRWRGREGGGEKTLIYAFNNCASLPLQSGLSRSLISCRSAVLE